MSLVLSLLHAIVRLDGEAVVMHVGDRPYVVTPNGHVDLATRGLTLDAVNGIVGQVLTPEAAQAFQEFGATQGELAPLSEFPNEQFTIVVARSGDDVWAEIRRRHLPPGGPSEATPSAAPPSPALTPAPAPPAVVAAGHPVVEPARPVPPPPPMPAPETPPPPPVVSAFAPDSNLQGGPETSPTAESAALRSPFEGGTSAMLWTPGDFAAGRAKSTPVPDTPTFQSERAAERAEATPSDETLPPAVVLPLARNPIRPDAPRPIAEDALAGLDRLLRLAAARGASTLYLSSAARPSVRVDGDIQVLAGAPVLGPNDVESLRSGRVRPASGSATYQMSAVSGA